MSYVGPAKSENRSAPQSGRWSISAYLVNMRAFSSDIRSVLFGKNGRLRYAAASSQRAYTRVAHGSAAGDNSFEAAGGAAERI